MVKAIWVVVILCTVVAGFLLLEALVADSAPKQAAAAAVAVAFAVIPYVFARAVGEIAAPRSAPARALPAAEQPGLVRCTKCECIYPANAHKCPSCSAHRLDALPLAKA